MDDTDKAKTIWGPIETWNVTKVKDFSHAFALNRDRNGYSSTSTSKTASFTGATGLSTTGLSAWITSSVTSLESTFDGASAFNAGLGGWDVSKVR
jgi:hypothetical protein